MINNNFSFIKGVLLTLLTRRHLLAAGLYAWTAKNIRISFPGELFFLVIIEKRPFNLKKTRISNYFIQIHNSTNTNVYLSFLPYLSSVIIIPLLTGSWWCQCQVPKPIRYIFPLVDPIAFCIFNKSLTHKL